MRTTDYKDQKMGEHLEGRHMEILRAKETIDGCVCVCVCMRMRTCERICTRMLAHAHGCASIPVETRRRHQMSSMAFLLVTGSH